MTKRFSLILNTRDRPLHLNILLESIKNNTYNLNDIEVLISADNDDGNTLWFVENNKILWPWTTFEFIDRDKNLHKRLNSLAKKAKGKYIWVLNDDCEILTKNWDNISYNILENIYNIDGIKYGHTKCNSADKKPNTNYSSFPIISKKAVETIGYFMNDNIIGLGGDVHIWRIYNEINRIIDLPINIRHTLHETVVLVINPDKTASEMRENTYKYNIDYWNVDISKEINRLNEKIINSI